MWRVYALLAMVLAAGCSEVVKQPEVAPNPVPPPTVEIVPKKPSTETASPTFKADTLTYLAKRGFKPQPTRPLNAQVRCSHHDAVGTATQLDLLVKEAEVKTFDAQVAIKGYGTCRFNLDDFNQAEKLPQALLRHKRELDCTVRLWEEEQKITIAFNSCPKSCEGDAFSYLWPILVEEKSGHCF